LFSGTQSIAKALRRRGWEVLTLDVDSKTEPDICCDIRDWDYTEYPPRYFDYIHASPCCVMYSIARTNARTPRDFVWADSLVEAALKIIDYFQPRAWTLENPESGYLKTRPIMQEVPIICDQDYCQWGGPYRKRTRLWGHIPGGFPTRRCDQNCPVSDGRRHLHTAQRLWSRGRRDTDPRYSVDQLHSIPESLCTALAEAIETNGAA
jgi:hypothetical protein